MSADITNKAKITRMKLNGLSEYQAKFYIKAWNEKISVVEDEEGDTLLETAEDFDKTNIEKTFKNNSGNIDVTSTIISTVDQAIEACEIDLEFWEIVSSTVGSWNTTMKLKDTDGSYYPITKTNYTIKLPSSIY